ncbi:hypothetical protein BDF19DRAFT_472920 [Syncephalis fuscata]|nr:hypothetical protein BDF19DRAFT_472920 [Syncephalis fuscata]
MKMDVDSLYKHLEDYCNINAVQINSELLGGTDEEAVNKNTASFAETTASNTKQDCNQYFVVEKVIKLYEEKLQQREELDKAKNINLMLFKDNTRLQSINKTLESNAEEQKKQLEEEQKKQKEMESSYKKKQKEIENDYQKRIEQLEKEYKKINEELKKKNDVARPS